MFHSWVPVSPLSGFVDLRAPVDVLRPRAPAPHPIRPLRLRRFCSRPRRRPMPTDLPAARGPIRRWPAGGRAPRARPYSRSTPPAPDRTTASFVPPASKAALGPRSQVLALDPAPVRRHGPTAAPEFLRPQFSEGAEERSGVPHTPSAAPPALEMLASASPQICCHT